MTWELKSACSASSNTLEVHSYESADAMPSAYSELFAKAEAQYPEFSADWFTNLHRTVFRSDQGIRYYVATRNSRPVALLPIRIASYGIARRVEALGNHYTSLYTPILAPDATELDLAKLLQAVRKDYHRLHEMRFSPMDPADPAFGMTQAALRAIGWLPFQYFCFGNWYLTVNSNWLDYFKTRAGELRSTIKRKSKAFAAAGGTLEIISDSIRAESAISDFIYVYAHSWKKPEPDPDFIPGLVRWLAATNRLRLGIARIEGKPIAAQIWIINHNKASIFKLAYDEAQGHYAPGTLLTAHMMEYVISHDHVLEVDYLVGDDEYKKLWMSNRRERWGIVAYNPASIIGVSLLSKEIAGRALRKAMTMTQQYQLSRTTWEFFPITQFDVCIARWDSLQRSCANLPFLESSFLKPLLSEFGSGKELVAFGYKDGKLSVATILTKRRLGVWQTFQPAQLPLGAWVSDSNDNLAELSASLLRSLPGLNLNLSLTQIDPLFHPRPENQTSIRTMNYIETAWVNIDQPFDSYWEARGKNLRTNMRKQRSKLQTENVALSLECLVNPEAMAEAIEAYGILESAGWKGKDGTAVHPNNAQGRFYRTMLENFCAQGRGRVYRYLFNDKVVAMDLCIEAGNQIVILKTAYDETYKAVSPSILMRQDEFHNLFAEGKFKRIEFYGKVMEWHTRWTENMRTLYHLTAYRSRVISKLHAWRQQHIL